MFYFVLLSLSGILLKKKTYFKLILGQHGFYVGSPYVIKKTSYAFHSTNRMYLFLTSNKILLLTTYTIAKQFSLKP